MRVVIAEDAALMREGLVGLLEDHGHQICATVTDAHGLLTAVAEHHPDVAVVDIRMPPPHTDEGLRAVDFVDELTRVAAGGTALDPEVVSQLLGTRRDAHGLADLTPREREVLARMAEGRSNTGIAAALTVTVGVVEKHVANIFSKLGLPPTEGDNRRVLAVLRYLASANT
jgi:DNA-binding NarL/FixJ family response regulator